MSARVDGLKQVKEIDSKIATLDEKTRQHEAVMLATSVQHQREVDAWKARVLESFDEGGGIPTEPEPVKPSTLRLAGDHLARLRHEREGLVRERLKAVAAGGPTVIESATKAVNKAVKQAAPLLAELDGLLQVLKEARIDISTVVDASNAISTNGVVKAPEQTPIDLRTLALAVESGQDPLHPDKVHAERVLGMQREVVHADGSTSYTPAPSPNESKEYQQTLDAALRAQRLSMGGSGVDRPLGYRPANV